MPPASRPAVASIPAWADFAANLAGRLMAEAGGDPLGLSTTLLLPNRRAAAALTGAFLRRGRGLLLPQMVAIGDLADSGPLLEGAAGPDAPAAVDPEVRRFELARILRGRGMPAPAALREAATLGAALDTLAAEELGPRDLARVDAGELSAYWQQTLDHLRAISSDWPRRLAAMGRIDASARWAGLLRALARRWREDQAGGRRVVAAGIVAAPPPVAALLAVVARLPRGLVVLPGLDHRMPEPVWEALDPDDPAAACHPQAALKALLDAMGVARGEVEAWEPEGAPARARVEAAARALDPAAFTGARDPASAAALGELALVEAANPAEEALLIAAAMRRTLETPGRTAALVTPDRALAARVVAALGRWDITADDSAGVPLSATPPAVFVRLIAAAAAQGFAPVPLLALLKHPFAGSADRLAHLDRVRALDLRLRRAPGTSGLGAIGRIGAEVDAAWWRAIEGALAPLGRQGEDTLPGWLARLGAAASALGGERPWAAADGRALADMLERTALASEPLGAVEVAALPGLLALLLGEETVRPTFGLHPRLAIYGLLEARLQRADLMILGGLNEGVWPAPPAPDAWLPPAVLRALGLPPAERRIGLAAHDFIAALGAGEVLLTRARRDSTAPTAPSRFLLRLQAMAAPAGGLGTDAELLGVARGLDAADGPPKLASRPAPAPPADARPNALSVTEVDTLHADPYAFYARRILKLGELDPLGAALSPARRGEFLHAALEAWAHSGEGPEQLVPQAQALFDSRFGGEPRLAALWRPRLMRALGWAAARLAERQQAGWRLAAAEAGGAAELHGVTLRGRADRVEARADGTLAIIDFKSGSMPSKPRIAAGYALQLPLLALLAERGALAGVAPGAAAELEYWRLGGGRSTPGEVQTVFVKDAPWADGPEVAAHAARMLGELAGAYLTGTAAFTAKLKPEYADVGRTYDQLARLDEWVDR